MGGHRSSFRAVVLAAFLVLAVVACGDDDETSGATTDDSSDASDTGSASGDDADSDDTGDKGDTGAPGVASVTVAGTGYEFPDVVECEIDGDTWGEGYRRLVAWSDDGFDQVDITVANEDSASVGVISSITVHIGLTNPNTLDEGNPDEEWSSLLGDGTDMTADLTPDGASGSASVGQASGETGTAEFSFAC